MSDTIDTIEQRLIKSYGEQTLHYDQALAIMEQAQIPGNAQSNRSGWSSELQGVLNEISALDANIASDKSEWARQGRTPGPTLRTLLEKIANQIRLLAELVDRQVAALSARRQQLVPELDGFIRQRRMLQAYDQYRRPFANR